MSRSQLLTVSVMLMIGIVPPQATGAPVHTTTFTTTTSQSTLAYGTISLPGSGSVNYVYIQNPNSIAISDILAIPGIDARVTAGLNLILTGASTVPSGANYTLYSNNVAFSDGKLTSIGSFSAQAILNAGISTHAVALPTGTATGNVTASEGTVQVQTQISTDSNIVVNNIIIGTNTNINTNTDTVSLESVTFAADQFAPTPAPSSLLLAILGCLALLVGGSRRLIA